MAKKTLSMSLVVAMLATSNVPVWAAEFSDGSEASVATEAPASRTTTGVMRRKGLTAIRSRRMCVECRKIQRGITNSSTC